LVREFENPQGLGGVVVAKPAPTGALDGDCPFGHLIDEIFEGAVLTFDLLGEGGFVSGVFTSSLSDGGEVLPIDGVVDVSSEVELDGLAEGGHLVVVEVGLGL
jgi:hypothetical protein